MKQGIFITIEGPEGAGKSTILPALKDQLEAAGYPQVVLTREPGGSRIAEQVRQVLLDVDNIDMDFRTEALLFAAARRQHLVDIVLPALAAGKIVICDRFVDSSLAYQGIARGIDPTDIWSINQFAIQGYMPSLTLLVDVPASLGLERVYKARHQSDIDRLDRESLAFHESVRQAFLDLAKQEPRIQLVDGSQPIVTVIDAAYQLIVQHLDQTER
ncbi:TPA: dTMP kinase [Streptococcus suis]